MTVLEICCYSAACALTAQQNGADRIELCAAPKEGGLTPSLGVLKSVRRSVALPVHPIVRPRGGDFCYDDAEFAAMLDDICAIRELGFPGVVTGVLNEDGQIDMARMQRIMQAARGMAVTFHRAFDMCVDPYDAASRLGELGVARILTSGQRSSAEKGILLLTELNARAGVPIIMAGSGVRAGNLDGFLAAGIREVHSSAGQFTASPMRYRNTGLSMSADTSADEYSRYRVDGDAVARMKAKITRHHQQ